jgi:hypothetical protein
VNSAREKLRRRFLPSELRLLLIGESPPASGRFFYQQDSGLYRATREAFQIGDRSVSDTNFLEIFQARGCYLIDLCPDPVDQLQSKDRRAACLASESSLKRALGRLRPELIATVVRSIEENVERAAAAANWHGSIEHLPYPGRWSRHRDIYVQQLARLLHGLS